MSRRAFLHRAFLTAVATSAVVLDRMTQPVGMARALPWLARGQARRLAGKPAVVALASGPTYDYVRYCLRDLWHQSAMPVVSGKRVLVKPNLIDSIEGHPATTAPEVVAAVVDLLAELGDGPGFRREARPVAEAVGLAEFLARRKTPFVDLNYDDRQPVAIGREWFLHERKLWLPRHVREADLIVSVPKLKTNHWAGVSLSLRNLFRIVPGVRYGWPKNMLHINGIPHLALARLAGVGRVDQVEVVGGSVQELARSYAPPPSQ